MNLPITEIYEGQRYTRSGRRVRKVISIRDGLVTYSIDGVFSLLPSCMPMVEFALWAEEAVDPAC